MASKTEKILINAATFPFTYANTPRAAIVNSDPSPRMPPSFFGSRANADYGMAQLIYCENVIPYAKGIYSVAFNIQAAAITPSTTACDQVIQIRDALENVFMLIPAAGANYIYNPATGTWGSVSPLTPTGNLVTKAYVNGRTFICYEKTAIIEYDTAGNVFNTISLTYPGAFTIADVRGIGGASNYLLFFTDFAIYWCSPLNILDFSNIDAGAGNITPIDIKGQITSLLPINGGFVVYTVRNAIGATFTNDAAAPFIFKEINNCGGCTSWELIAESSADSGHYMWGTNGLQKITLTQADSVFPEVTDFLVGKRIERWNASTKRVDIVAGSSVFNVKLCFLAGRFLVISYGQDTTYFEFALIYDSVLDRWGKVRIDHSDAFMYPYPSGSGNYYYNTLPGFYDGLLTDYATLGIFFLQVVPTKQGIAYMKNTGEINIMSTDFAQTSAPGVAIFGHLDLQHSNWCTLQDITMDGILSSPTPVVTAISSYDGLNKAVNTTMYLDDSSGNYRRFRSRVSAWNHDIAIEGSFVFSTALVSLVGHGYR